MGTLTWLCQGRAGLPLAPLEGPEWARPPAPLASHSHMDLPGRPLPIPLTPGQGQRVH